MFVCDVFSFGCIVEKGFYVFVCYFEFEFVRFWWEKNVNDVYVVDDFDEFYIFFVFYDLDVVFCFKEFEDVEEVRISGYDGYCIEFRYYFRDFE